MKENFEKLDNERPENIKIGSRVKVVEQIQFFEGEIDLLAEDPTKKMKQTSTIEPGHEGVIVDTPPNKNIIHVLFDGLEHPRAISTKNIEVIEENNN